MKKEDMVHICNRILLCHRKEQNNIICSNMVRARDYHTKWSKPERKDKYHMISHTWNLKYDTNEPIYETEAESGT